MTVSNQLLTRSDLVRLVLDGFDELKSDCRNAYNIGMEVGKKKGKEFRSRVQQATSLVSSYISDLLVEILSPLVLEESEIYLELRNRYLGEFISGLVKATQ